MTTIEELQRQITEKDDRIAGLELKITEMDKSMGRLGADVLAFGDMIRQMAGIPKRGEEVPQVKEEESLWGKNMRDFIRACKLSFGRK